MSKSEPKPSVPNKPGRDVKKPALEIKPQKDLEPDESQSEEVRGGNGGAGGPGRGHLVFSDATLKGQVAPVRHALMKLRKLQF